MGTWAPITAGVRQPTSFCRELLYVSPLLEQVFLADLLSEEPGSFADRIKEQFGLEGTFKGFEEEDLK